MAGLSRTSFAPRAIPSLTAVVPTVKHVAKIEANTSASQHKTFDMCRRKWAFQKVWGVKEKERQHFIFGHALHSVAERYILGKTTTWEDLFPKAWNKGLDEYESNQIRTMATKAVERGVWQAVPNSVIEFPLAFLVGPEHVDARGLPLLATANTYLDEHEVRRISQLTTLYDGSPLPSGWNRLPPYVGFIDHMILWDTPPTIADHKTAKNRKYATTPAKLAEDLQVLSYAAVPLSIRPDVDLVRLRHNIFLKNEGAADPYVVPAVAPLDKVRATWDHIRSNATDMLHVRQEAPKIQDASNPYARANNWQKVKSAIEDGRTKDACEAYGGCPFKDVCFGRATAEQVLRRIDAPDIRPLIQQPEPVFGLRGRPAPTAGPKQVYNAPSRFAPADELDSIFTSNHTQEFHMAFSKPALAPLTINQDAYIVDPEDAASQFRARIIALTETEASIALYPNPDVAPDFATLSTRYRETVPKESVLTLPHVSAKVKGYQDSLIAAGVTDGLEWAAAPIAAADKPISRPARDGAFGIKAAPAAAPAPAPEKLPAGTPEWALPEVPNGLVLTVNPTTHLFWLKYAGKTAIVTGSGPGEIEGSTHLHVEIDGLPFYDANAHRFTPQTASAAPTLPLSEKAKGMKGSLVSIRLTSTESPFNCVLEDVTTDGISFLNGQMKATWDQVKSIETFSLDKLPGAPPSAEQKAAAKAAAKAEKAAAKEATKPADAPVTAQQAVPGTESVPTIEPGNALQNAIEAVQAVLNGGKVTRKALEGIVPLLQAAQVHQTNLEGVAQGAVGAAIVPSQPQVSGLIRVAIEHAISTLADAKAKLP